MESQMIRDVHTLQNRKQAADLSKTWRGKLWQLVGYAFSVYCVYRVFMVRRRRSLSSLLGAMH
jgi:hypothetical protein